MFGKLSSQPLLISRSTRPYRYPIKYIRYRSYGVKRCGYTDETQPFWTILLSLIFLNEKVRKYQIIAMIVAILGMLFIVKPEFSSTMITSLVGLFSGIFLPLHTHVFVH